MAPVKSYYVFDLPEPLKRSLSPFKYDVGGETDSEPEADSSDQSDSEVEDKPQAEDGQPHLRTDIAPSASHSTQYTDDYEDTHTWKMANLAHITGHPYVYFTSAELLDEHILAVYKSLLDKSMIADNPVGALDQLQSDGHSAVLLIGGGHFAGAIIGHRRGNHKLNISNPFANINIMESKAFHRYTTRRKQGGAQSASDNAHGKANSAGSTIRRQNEAALRLEVQELLQKWSPLLCSCQRIFFRAAGRSNRGIITGYPGAAVKSDDPRLHSIPFSMGRPTVDEVKRAWLNITRASVVPAPQLGQADSIGRQKAPLPRNVDSPAVSSASPVPLSEEEKLTNEIVKLVKQSKLGPLKDFFKQHALDLDFGLAPPQKYKGTPTTLAYAVKAGKHNVVNSLLELGANPRVGNVPIGNLTKEKKMRDTLQTARHTLGESKWDWDSIQVGPPLSKADIAARDLAEKLTLQKAQAEEFERAEQEAKTQRLEKLISKHGSGHQTKSANTGMGGLTEDEKRHVERERRARAAEARLARLSR